jgi:hypothetical protein
MGSIKVVTEWRSREFVAPSVLENASSSGSSTEELIELQTSLNETRGLVCYLLRKNHHLRMQLSAVLADRQPK